MDVQAGLEYSGLGTRSFRDEDYNNRRVFLRSYPLDWEIGEGASDHDHHEEGLKSKPNSSKECSSSRKRPIKKIILSVFHWGGGKAEKCTVLEAALKTKTAYIDVCDDTAYAFRAKSFHDRAVAANVPAITTGEKIKLRPYSGMLKIDFGKGIGKKDVYLLNLPEVRSTHEILGVPTVSARFGTAPFFWNWAMEAMTALLPAELLRDRSKVQQMVKMFDPVVRAVDEIAGERVSMRVDLDCSGGRNTVSVFSHKKLSVSVGTATTAFVLAVLEGSTKPGVWFPEEAGGIAIEAREVLLKRAAQGTINFVTNKPAWMVETNPKELGLGIYV
ncbi:hypothetical protein ACLB2K_022348 [Fragaria x ananassa]